MFPISFQFYIYCIVIKTVLMATVRFILQQPFSVDENGKVMIDKKGKKIDNPKETRLYAFLIIQRGQVIKVKTQHTVLPKEWEKDKQRKGEKVTGAIEFNHKLSTFKSELLATYDATLQARPDITLSQLKEILVEWGRNIERPIKVGAIDFYQVFDIYLERLKTTNSHRTIQKFNSVKASLLDFAKDNPRYRQMSFSLVDRAFLNSFRLYLMSKEPGKKSGRQNHDQRASKKDCYWTPSGNILKALRHFADGPRLKIQ
jgi:hypothetical protein